MKELIIVKGDQTDAKAQCIPGGHEADCCLRIKTIVFHFLFVFWCNILAVLGNLQKQ